LENLKIKVIFWFFIKKEKFFFSTFFFNLINRKCWVTVKIWK
jgi:hypothetical protein